MIDLAKVIPLFSGSKGNSYYIGSSGEGVLIDAGRNCKQLEAALEQSGVAISSIGAIFITHEHIDHCQGLRVFAKRYDKKIYASAGTLEAMKEKNLICAENRCEVITDSAAVGNMRVVRCDTPHDARESCCFQVETADGRRAVVATDMGVMTDPVRELIRGSDFAVVESNHDVRMLKLGPYPYPLKQRILSANGHMNNDDCAAELAEFVRCGNFRLMLGHLSEQNNTPELALNTALAALKSCGMKDRLDFTLTTAAPVGDGKAVIF